MSLLRAVKFAESSREFCRKKEPHFSSSAVRFNGGRARGPCSFGGY